MDLYYFAEVPHNSHVWLSRPKTEIPPWSGIGRKPTLLRVVSGQPATQTVAQIAASISEEEWQTRIVKEGEKGAMIASFAFRRVFGVRDQLPGNEVWLVLRRSGTEIKTFLTNAPASISLNELIRVSAMRWTIEMSFKEAKQHLGMGDDQLRSWTGWHHHQTLVILAHFFVVQLRLRSRRIPLQAKQKSDCLTFPQIFLLLSTVLPIPPRNTIRTLAIVSYYNLRNYAAYLSHRKHRLKGC